MTDLALCTLAVGVISLVVWYCLTRWQQCRRYPPGPVPYPLIGNLQVFFGGRKMWTVMTDIQEQHGDVFTLFLGSRPTVILGTVEVIREAFITKQNDFAGRPVTFSFDHFTKGGKDIIGGQYSPVWRQQRKIAFAAIRKYATAGCLQKLIQDSTHRTFVEMDKMADTGQSFSPRHSLNVIIYNIICSMVFGKTHDDPTLQRVISLVDEVNESFGTGIIADFFPIFKYIPTKGLTSVKAVTKELHQLVKEVYEEHENTYNESELTDVVYYMLHTVKEVEREEGKQATQGLTKEHYQMVILDIFSAGTDTSRFTLIWVVLFLTAYPEHQSRIQHEVDTVIGDGEAVRMEHRAHLPYLEAFIHEVMRMRPIAPFSVPHATTCATSVGGYPIPAGTQVMPNIWAVHMDRNHWDDPTAFKPERFLTEEGKMAPAPASWLPFSTGRRVCVGEALAKAELLLVTAALVRRYSFAAPPGVTIDVRWAESGKLMMPDDYNVVLNRRAGAGEVNIDTPSSEK